jgi:hypothetical protein
MMLSRQRKIALTALACVIVLASAVNLAGGASQALAAQAPPGSAYCGRANLDDAVTLVAFAHRVSCRYAMRFAHRCLHSSSLHGWDFKGERGYTGLFELTRNKSIIWLEDAGGTARCLAR